MLCKLPREKTNAEAYPSVKPINNDSAWYYHLKKPHSQHLSTKMMIVCIRTGQLTCHLGCGKFLMIVNEGILSESVVKKRISVFFRNEHLDKLFNPKSSLNTSMHEQHKIYNNICNTYVKIITADKKSWIWGKDRYRGEIQSWRQKIKELKQCKYSAYKWSSPKQFKMKNKQKLNKAKPDTPNSVPLA